MTKIQTLQNENMINTATLARQTQLLFWLSFSYSWLSSCTNSLLFKQNDQLTKWLLYFQFPVKRRLNEKKMKEERQRKKKETDIKQNGQHGE